MVEILNGSLKINEHQSVDEKKGTTEAERGTPKEKLEFVNEKLKEVITALEAIKSEASPSELLRYISLTLTYAGQFSKALEAALKVEEKSIDIQNLSNFAGELHRMIETMGSYTGHAANPGKTKDLQLSAFSAVGEIGKTVKDLQADLN
ncbi:hypothetical protein DdX_17190 [Ditylenchus destructor]|uniref:Uncharacterized protein n=1 Tax=Ditylenchus destructor TaxID=166010 RepID=A0AAD4MML4_9BILA|nr:hypothetical protein DdX_17190 [Ditylenchus destructor]